MIIYIQMDLGFKKVANFIILSVRSVHTVN